MQGDYVYRGKLWRTVKAVIDGSTILYFFLLDAFNKERQGMVPVVRLVGKTVADVVGHDTAIARFYQEGIITLEVGVTAGTGAGAVQEHNNIALPLIDVVNLVAVGALSVIRLRQESIHVHKRCPLRDQMA